MARLNPFTRRPSMPDDSILDRLRRRVRWIGHAMTLPPIAGGAGEGDGGDADGGDGGEGDKGGAGDGGEGDKGGAGDGGDAGGEGDDDDGRTGKSAEELRRELRTSDRVRKREAAKKEAELKALREKLEKQEDDKKTEHERALDKAREEARNEAEGEARKLRREDRLEVAVARAAGKTFADVDDALLRVKRRMADGDLDETDLFDDADKVKSTTLKETLDEILEASPHLKAGGSPAGDGGGGRGSSAGGAKLEDMSADDHLKEVQSGRS